MAASAARTCDEDDLIASMRQLSIRRQSFCPIMVPPLSAFACGKPAVAVAGKEVVVGEEIARAETIRDNFPSSSDYFKAMQAHVQYEFEASMMEAVSRADDLPGGGWRRVTCRPRPRKPDKLCFVVNGEPIGTRTGKDGTGGGNGPHSTKNSWFRHAIQFEGKSVPAVVVFCDEGETTNGVYLMIASAKGIKGGGVPPISRHLSTRVRSLGYIWTFFRQYGACAELARANKGGTSLVRAVAGVPGEQSTIGGPEGTLKSPNVGSLDKSPVPVNAAQRDAVMGLTGGLDIIVGPPGAGKSTTIYHIIGSRVAKDARVLITSTRNQAIDAVTGKVHTFGVLVFGNEHRLGDFAKQFTLDGRMLNDPELAFWRRTRTAWATAVNFISPSPKEKKRRPANFPGLTRLRRLAKVSRAATLKSKKSEELRKRGRVAGLWVRALNKVLKTIRRRRSKKRRRDRRRIDRQSKGLTIIQKFLRDGFFFTNQIVRRLELLTRFRILTETRVFVSTIDSAAGSLHRLRKDIIDTSRRLSTRNKKVEVPRVTLDTAIVDEAACVMEHAIPVILSLGVKNLTLVGDHNQLRPFSHVRESEAVKNHSRSLMERAIDAGVKPHFLNTQYRMHPRISEIVSRTFYENQLLTAEELKLKRMARQPCKWVHVSGGEIKHRDEGYSNPREVPLVVKQAKAAMQRYGKDVDIRVITFYNMQKHELECAIKREASLRHIRIVSVDSCQGSDADVIIISAVRSRGPGKLSGFMLDRSRLCVALSRAKEECIIVGDKKTLRSNGGDVWKAVVDHYT